MAVRGLALLLVGVLGAVGCGGSEDAAEQSVGAGREGVDVDIDQAGGRIAMRTETDEGTHSFSLGQGQVPQDFPVPLPAGGTVLSTLESEGAGGTGSIVTVQYAGGDFDRVAKELGDWLRGQAGDAEVSRASIAGMDMVSMASEELKTEIVVQRSEDTTSVTASVRR